ncbi:hypothetical protein VaNZ11_013403 [Volvox africanus]|uniref:Clp1 P-loop domain-containing protein n=1 Tax=Volvox africanus TaxID=51714 RepID=A0ABQ5SHC5_9CHLO|nr:hypothetical protein VaNZ11_013403 [Volvox africanus]
MGHEKKRRKSGGPSPAQPLKERRIDGEYPSWKDYSGYTVLQLLESQSVLFVGEAILQVLHGAVRVAGKLVTVESPPLVLSTGGRFSLAIKIVGEAYVTQVPFAASQEVVEVSLQSRPPLPLPVRSVGTAADRQGPRTGQGDQEDAAAAVPSTAPSPCTFDLYHPTDQRAPPSMLVSKEWAQAIEDVCSAACLGVPVVVAVLGAKGMGKSSLARLVANRLLDECPTVAFLDTDVGQPEFTPPGLLSLHLMQPGSPVVGPPHAHSRQPWASRFVGDVSSEHDPQLYLIAVQALYASYWNWAQGLVAGGAAWPPLVVNTHGWVKGLGFDLLTQLLRVTAPTHIIQIRGGVEKKNLPHGAFWCDPQNARAAAAAPLMIITLEALVSPGPQTPSGRGPKGSGSGGAGSSSAVTLRSLKAVESRALAWHAWAKRVVGAEPAWGSYESEDFWHNAGELAALAPWCISLDDVHVQLLGGSLAPQQIGRLLNGAVVGLLATSPPPRQASRTRQPAAAAAGGAASTSMAWWDLDAATASAAAAAYPRGRISYIGASSTPPPLLPCVGLGIVRAVDMASRVAYVLTDADADVLECVGVFVVGRLELPGSLVVGGGVAWPYQQLFGLVAEATGAKSGKARKNLSRLSLVELAG